MADCIPFNSIDHDRVYKAEDWAWYFSTFLGNGVFPKPSQGLQVKTYSGMRLKVNAGYAFINGYAFRNQTAVNLTLDMAEGALDRIDRVVVRWDLTKREIYLDVLKGTPSGNPKPEEITRNAEIWELALADIYVEKGVISIRAADITDRRFDSSVCGIVKGTIEEIDASVLTSQFDDFFRSYSQKTAAAYGEFVQRINEMKADEQREFETWFAKIKNILSGDVAGNLQTQIENIKVTTTLWSGILYESGTEIRFYVPKQYWHNDNLTLMIDCVKYQQEMEFVSPPHSKTVMATVTRKRKIYVAEGGVVKLNTYSAFYDNGQGNICMVSENFSNSTDERIRLSIKAQPLTTTDYAEVKVFKSDTMPYVITDIYAVIPQEQEG